MCTVKLVRLTSILICCISTTHCLDENDIYCTINTKSGRIRGKQNQTLFEKIPYFSFRGIPFAEAPIGKLRFKVKTNLNLICST